MDNTELVRRFRKLESERKTVEQTLQAVEQFIMPYRGQFFQDQRTEHSVDWSATRKVFDSTGIVAHQTLASSLHGALTSPSIRWFDLRYRSEELNNSKRAVEWIQGVSERVHNELQDSNFNLEINETYQDICGYGTSFITLEEVNPKSSKWEGLNFSSVPLKEGYFEEDENGRILRFYRHLQWAPSKIIAKFGEDVPPIVKERDEAGGTDKMDLLFVVVPRNNNIAGIAEMNRSKAPSKRPYEYKYILLEGAATLGKPGGYYEMPSFAGRWRKTSGSQWGNSPAMLALYDVITLNEAREMQLRMAEKMIDPPILAEERAILSDLNLGASEINIVRSVQGIEAWRAEGNLPISDHMINQLQESIRDYFFIDQLRMPAQQAQPMTATEIQLRYEQMQRLLGPTLGRLANDILDPIISRTVRMLARAGELPEAPPIVIEADAQWDILYLGSLARSQRVDQAAAIERMLMTVANGAQVLPDMLMVLDPIELVRHMGKDLNIPAAIMRDKDEIEAMQEEQKAAQAQAQQQMLAQQEGEAAKAQGEGAQAMQAATEVPQ
jgi:hypothetical protein